MTCLIWKQTDYSTVADTPFSPQVILVLRLSVHITIKPNQMWTVQVFLCQELKFKYASFICFYLSDYRWHLIKSSCYDILRSLICEVCRYWHSKFCSTSLTFHSTILKERYNDICLFTSLDWWGSFLTGKYWHYSGVKFRLRWYFSIKWIIKTPSKLSGKNKSQGLLFGSISHNQLTSGW